MWHIKVEDNVWIICDGMERERILLLESGYNFFLATYANGNNGESERDFIVFTIEINATKVKGDVIIKLEGFEGLSPIPFFVSHM